jgi:hypothetical protein
MRALLIALYTSSALLVVKIKRKSPEHPPQFQGVLRLAEGSKRLILSTSRNRSGAFSTGCGPSYGDKLGIFA